MTTRDITTPVDSTTTEDTTLAVRDKGTALAANPQLAAQTSALEVMRQRALILLDSGLLPDSIGRWQQAAAIMMRAEELDVDYWTGLMHLNAIKGAPQPDGQLCMALIQRSELMERYEILETTDQRCTIRMKRYGQPAFHVTCTYQEYEKVAGPDGKRQPKTHLFWYTYKQGARRLFSDVLNNMQPKSNRRQFIVEDDLPTDLPADDSVFVVEEGEDKPTASVPLSAAPSARNDSSASATGSADSDKSGSLDMKALQERALSTGIAQNEFHFQNLLKLLLADGTIRQGITIDEVLDAMGKHKAEKEKAESISEGELVEEPQLPDAFDDSFPPIGITPTEAPVRPTIGSLNMDSLWLRSHVNPRSAFDALVLSLRKSRKISDPMTADQVIDAVRAYQAAAAFTSGEAGGVEE